MLPMLKEVMKFTDADKLEAAFASLGGDPGVPPAVVMALRSPPCGLRRW